MTGKNALPQIRHNARQALIRRQGLGLPSLCVKARLARAERLIDRLDAKAEVTMAKRRWTAHVEKVAAWHKAGCPADQVKQTRFGLAWTDEEVERMR